MKEREYKARVDCYETVNGNLTVVTFAEGAKELLKKPFVTMCRINDRLFFIPKDNNRTAGAVMVGDVRISFGRSQEHKSALDFRGEYDTIHVNKQGNVYLDISEKRSYTRTRNGCRGVAHPAYKRDKEPAEQETEVPASTSLGEMLVSEIEKTKAEIAELYDEKGKIEESLKNIVDRIEWKKQAQKNFEAALLSIDITGRHG